jgi:hypothetical protein
LTGVYPGAHRGDSPPQPRLHRDRRSSSPWATTADVLVEPNFGVCPFCAHGELIRAHSGLVQRTMIGRTSLGISRTSGHFRDSMLRPENPGVGGSTPSLSTIFFSALAAQTHQYHCANCAQIGSRSAHVGAFQRRSMRRFSSLRLGCLRYLLFDTEPPDHEREFTLVLDGLQRGNSPVAPLRIRSKPSQRTKSGW